MLSTEDPTALPGLRRLVHAKSALNRVPGGSPMPFSWTVNPYRGCSHGCVYCFARRSHTYLDFDAGRDFDTQIVVKTNVGSVLRKEVSSPSWAREHVAMGTNTDPYQRAEGRYRLMPEIIGALADSGTPFSILTKGTVLSRDLPLLTAAASSVPVGVGVSLALLDPELQATLEPGTPTPRARLELVRRIREAGLPCGVFVAPILPLLTDTPEQLRALVGPLAQAGATGVTGISLHLRPGTGAGSSDGCGGLELVPPTTALYEQIDRRRLPSPAAQVSRSRRVRAGSRSGQPTRRTQSGARRTRRPGGVLPRRQPARRAGETRRASRPPSSQPAPTPAGPDPQAGGRGRNPTAVRQLDRPPARDCRPGRRHDPGSAS